MAAAINHVGWKGKLTEGDKKVQVVVGVKSKHYTQALNEIKLIIKKYR